MKLQQLRYLCEVAKQGLNVSAAAEKLYTSQPGVSKQIRLLEEELGIDIFVRNGKRVTEITEPGKVILAIAERLLREAENLKLAGKDFSNESSGSLVIATTHTQARYALPQTVKAFVLRYPGVNLVLHQGNPTQVAQRVVSGEADIAIATETIAEVKELVSMPCHQWSHGIITPPKHPLLKEKTLSLEAIARYPIVTYDTAFAGRSRINRAFERKALTPRVVLTAIDSDVIKTYVELGLGIGIVARMAFDPQSDKGLRMLNADHLFESSTTRIGLRHGAYLRGYVYEFIHLFAPHLTRDVVDTTLRGGGVDFEL
ncbi:MAG: transcriptional regulator CysB [Betaproteobacteria bacterium CG2_30_59_46]|nr:MAG: transcriptional regulator CysB [Betaproteobacteria bacterium CG2_30_59_46]PIQ09773.1 MAG: HTH-type transcriptional regulator CysB [Hydrogenophilales bacterium CG18_big_fil_WC_8_21_14_2_50_58_12]PIY00957.1 MAG: HTH-type transcriptional regulator CysB [Hydrogenophilales bacterium CG_4_10_14_3_um_filter_58_23]PJB07546.1 MAG: HTH-type transcriptional regulator CysB [Hydrogenophilales bacterium CG_4_9_14_3_um_filter_59_35]